MKRIIIMVLFANSAWSLTFMGPTTSELELGQVGLGFDYSQSDISIRLESNSRSETVDIEARTYFARVLFGAGDGSEVSLRMGVSEIKEDAERGFSSNGDLAWGLGAKKKFGETGPVGWGAIFQVTSLYGEDSERIGPFRIEVEFEAYEIQVALGPTYRDDTLCVYGGPMLHLITGEIKDTSIDIKQESEFGGYVGLGWQFAENSHLNVEYQSTGDADMLGIGLIFKFSGPSKPEKRIPARRLTPIQKPKFDVSGRVIKSYTVKRDTSGEIIKDENGNFVFVPVYEEKK